MWLVAHVAFMTGFTNQFRTLISWTLSFLWRSRIERALAAGPVGR